MARGCKVSRSPQALERGEPSPLCEWLGDDLKKCAFFSPYRPATGKLRFLAAVQSGCAARNSSPQALERGEPSPLCEWLGDDLKKCAFFSLYRPATGKLRFLAAVQSGCAARETMIKAPWLG
jgi:hypothetical protein